MITVLDPGVRAEWMAFNAPFEGDIFTMYQDMRGLVTCAIGILCNSVGAAQRMTWTRADGSVASPAEVATEWHRVASLPPARVWTYYIDPVHGLHLAADELERVVLERLDQFAATLADFWPAWSTFPPEAQQALLSIAWAVGVGTAGFGLTGPRWPHLHAAVVALDWRAAADAGVISATNNPGVIPRNKANAALFMQAAAAAS